MKLLLRVCMLCGFLVTFPIAAGCSSQLSEEQAAAQAAADGDLEGPGDDGNAEDEALEDDSLE